ncbi:MAG: TetR/AcrR family transcriptional regulator [Gemmatimonadetes bacterium]|nr:TetR/AcrR family transcriptional regulator [Gemmatimonadota bacterium]
MPASHTAPRVEHRRRRSPEERPQQILDAALEIFGEQGLAAARLDDIARRAGIAKGTIYLYFPTKEELFKAVVRREVVTRIEGAEQFQRDNAALPTADLLRRFLANYWNSIHQKTSTSMFRIVISELQKFPDVAEFYGREVVARAWSVVAAMIQRGIDRGEFRPVDANLVTRVFVASFLMHGIWIRPDSPTYPLLKHLKPDDLRDSLIDFLLSSLAPRA